MANEPSVSRERSYTTVVTTGPKRRVMVPVPFDPDDAWGSRSEHHVSGTVDGMGVRAVLERSSEGVRFVLGPAWRRDCGVEPGDTVTVVLHPEGPQRDDLAPDLRTALEADDTAAAFWDSIAQFYRNAYLRWIDGTKRRPEVRAQRIGEVVALLAAGEKERPRG